jgi:hypothetical protein
MYTGGKGHNAAGITAHDLPSSKSPGWPELIAIVPMTDEIRQVTPEDDEISEVWGRDTDELILGVSACRIDRLGVWHVVVAAQEFFRQDLLGRELRQRVRRAMEQLPGTTGVAENNNETWHGLAQSVAISPDGSKVLVTGFVAGASPPSGATDWGTVAYRATTGAQLWARLYTPEQGTNYARGIVLSPDGSRAFVNGIQQPGQYETVAYKVATGARLWAASP